jgi:hypothetical protein
MIIKTRKSSNKDKARKTGTRTTNKNLKKTHRIKKLMSKSDTTTNWGHG